MYYKNKYLILFFVLILTSCIRKDSKKGHEFVFVKMKLSQGSYLTKDEPLNKKELENIAKVLIYYHIPFEFSDNKKIIVYQEELDTNFLYNVYIKSLNDDWLEGHKNEPFRPNSSKLIIKN